MRRTIVIPLLACGLSTLHAQERPAATPAVAVATVEEGTLDRSVRQAVTLFPYEKVMVYAKATGYAREVTTDIGDEVEAGQVLVALDIPEQEAELMAAQAEVNSAAAQIDRAHAQVALREALFNLTKDLFEREARNKFQLEEADAELKLARAELKLAEARRDEMKAKLDRVRALVSYARVRAPFAGVVTQRLVDSGTLVREGTSSGATALFEVQRTDKLRCRVEVPEIDSTLVLESFRRKSLGASFVVQGWTRELKPEDLAKGGVRFSKTLHPLSHHMIAELDISNEGGKLIPGLSGNVTLTALGAVGRSSVVLVPNAAIQALRKEPPFVFVVETSGGKTTVKKTRVELGVTDGSLTEVKQGLKATQRVVVRGAGTLIDGQEVVVPRDERAEEKTP